jgi:hypothetical protein
MLIRLRPRRPNHATVVAYLALFVALGGTTYAAATIGPSNIKNDAVRSRHIKDGAVKNPDLGLNSVGTAKIRPGAVTPGKLSADPDPTPVVGPTLNCGTDTSSSGRFCTGWAAYPSAEYEAPGYYRDGRGVVHFVGLAASSPEGCSDTLQGYIFRLPLGDRPAARHVFATNGNGGHARIDVHSTGEVACVNGNSTLGLSLDGVSFRAGV